MTPPASLRSALIDTPPSDFHTDITKDPTGFKDILRDNDSRDAWFASIKDELRNIIVSDDPPLRHLEYDAPGLRGLNGNAFGKSISSHLHYLSLPRGSLALYVP